MSEFRRRLLMMQAQKQGGAEEELAYWLCGEDAPSEGKWVDRVDPRFKWEIKNTKEDTYNKSEKCYYFDWSNPNGSFAQFDDRGSLLDCGTRFEWEIDCEIVENGASSNTAIPIDWGALANTSYNFGLQFNASNKFSTNYKMFGNDTNTQYGVSSINNNPPVFPLKQRCKLYFGVERYDDTKNIVYVKVNDGDKVYAPNAHKAVRHTDLRNKSYDIAKGFEGAFCAPLKIKIYNIKCRVQSYE